MQIYVVQTGDNVDRIAALSGVPVENIIYDNQIEYPYRLAVGQALFLRGDTELKSRTPLYVSGYAYPFINREVLEESLQWLTAIYIFSYGFTAEGELVPPESDDSPVIEAAIRSGVRPVLTLTPLGADGRFNNNLVAELVGSLKVQRRLIPELVRVMQQKGYEGLDIDFEYIRAEDRQEFARFVSRTTQIMNLLGYPVSVALAPKTSRDQPGLLYEGVDYRLLGAAANRAMLMTYEWGYTYGPPMAVAPLNMVRRVVDICPDGNSGRKAESGNPQLRI